MYRIMIIEDEEKIRNIIKKSLEKWSFEAHAVEDFNDIFEQFVKVKPNLVLMDINLPVCDGFYWCSKIRNISKVPVIFLSSRSSNMDVVMAVNMGGDDYITKPFSIEILMAKINAILRRTYSYSETEMDTIEFKDVIISLKNNTVYYNENSIELTKNEFKIIYVLMKNHDSIVSREKIMQELWQDESFIDDNTLTVNINRLRKKLKEIGVDFIKTIKGQGYVIK
ncbi:DNA-binding response OmpR family regulator [Clostridium acetobutylicum]|uniref:Stage 0 sporulation protein A homolog n=1 Tax=Clostridium acetobutylicum (strain ATCC 824 / DSM 792 / JCM 1419 / IAM 19013 / LMG 5710 / NBRC 13948 / NRRL B-527 / VKM B-1787 / 2291 / W) TaxID=272562 RepID=Q97MH4_CLOAB|nr:MULTISPECIES: response regulator transcription factor [Clostridium]AAK78205.1 Response regulator (CheY-like receiver domain and HTH DNA-binding domain) [Clostridium acetobutylicum ATCC 824]ADZ19270.1 Response regulator (CheY-like receiver domain and HTH DNA-binding domain) [Clostridium acetobutylicum EA 2018]AEI34140.1 response regulator [Clostridium acetobutylicum DSM 1731]AWV82013.1 DNA-binding response regulator [Clostridium acetobutylicum]MBC2395918.1 response regulator transcription fa